MTIRDYDFEKPEFILEAKKAIDPAGAFANEAALESYGFEVGKFELQTPGDRRAEALLEAERSPRRRFLCTASFALAAGTAVPLVDHPRPELFIDFLVVRSRLVSDFGKGQVRELELAPIAERFRPARRPKALIHGTQTAIVVGAAGEEIDVDKYGRVEVEFRWGLARPPRGRDVAARARSARVAGAGFGFVMLPRVNEEVIVAYLDGDPVISRSSSAAYTTPSSPRR